MLCKKEYKEVNLKYNFGCGHPFAIAFVFSKNGPHVIKGMESDILEYLKLNLGFCHYNITLWNNKKKFLEEWRINGKNWKIKERLVGDKKFYTFDFKDKSILNFRKIPKSYIVELEEFSKTKARKH